MKTQVWFCTLRETGMAVFSAIVCLALFAAPAFGQVNIPIENHSFEDPALGDGEWANNVHPEWLSSTSVASGVQNSTDGLFPGTTGNGSLPVPGDGLQFAFLNPGGSGLYQTVGSVEEGAEYTLTVAVGNRLDRTDPLIIDLEIISGPDRETGRLLAVTTTEQPEGGTFEDFSVSFVARSVDVGDLTVSIWNPAGQAIIDNVRLTALPPTETPAWIADFQPFEAPFSLNFGTGQNTGAGLLQSWPDDFSLRADSLRYETVLDSFVSVASLASVENYVTRQDFTLEADITLNSLMMPGDNRVGLVALGGPHDPDEAPFNMAFDSGFYGLVWTPAATINSSLLQIREGFDGEILAEKEWNGMLPFGDLTDAFFEDFENVAAVETSWTRGGIPSDLWEFGEPNNGPDEAVSGTNVAGTSLAENYPADADAWLRSPVIDLTAFPEATLSYYEWVDVDDEIFEGEMVHFLTVSILDPVTNEVIALIDEHNEVTDWRLREFDLPDEALGREIVLEFRLESDALAGDTHAGIFLDDVQISVRPRADPADFNFHAEGVFDSGGVLELTFTLTDEEDFSDSVTAIIPSPINGNLFGFGGRSQTAEQPSYDFHNFSMGVGNEPVPLDPIISVPFDFAFGSTEGRDSGEEFIRNVGQDWSLEEQSLRLSTDDAEYHNSLATSRVFNHQPGDLIALEAGVTISSLDAGTSDNRIGLVLFGDTDFEVFDPADDSTFHTLQWIPNAASGASIVVRQGMDGNIVAETDFADVDNPPQATPGTTYTFRFLGSYVGNDVEFVGVISDGAGGVATVSGTIPNAPSGNRFGFGARHSGAQNPAWDFHSFTWSDLNALAMPLDFHFGTASGRDGDDAFLKSGFPLAEWTLETGSLRNLRYDVQTGVEDERSSSTANVFDYAPGLDFAMRSTVTPTGETDSVLEFLGDGRRIVTEVTAGDLGVAGNNPRTIEAWAFARAFDNNGTVWTMGNHGTMGQDFTLKVTGTQNNWVVNQWGGAGSDVFFTAPGSLNGWIHIAVVHTGSETIVYVDGEEVAREDRVINTSTEQPFRMGWWQNRAQSTGFNGFIKDVRVWNVVRTEAEIQANMNVGLTGNESGLVANWPLNTGEGTTAFDVTSNNYHGAFAGPPVAAPEGMLPVTNHSFEAPALDDGDWQNGAPGWSGTGFGIQDWTDGEFAGTTGGGDLAAPGEGQQAAFINANGEVYQHIGPIAPNAEYTLTVAIGNRLDRNDPLEVELEIINGTDRSGTILASTTTSQPENGMFEDFSVTFTTGSEVSGELTVAINNPAGGQAIIDNVRLEAPEHALQALQIVPQWKELVPRFGLTFLGDAPGVETAYTFEWLPNEGNGGELRFTSPSGESESIDLGGVNGAPVLVSGATYTFELGGAFGAGGTINLVGTLKGEDESEAELTGQFPGPLPQGDWFGITGRHPSLEWHSFQMGTPEQLDVLPPDLGEPEEITFADWQTDNFGEENDPDIIGPMATPAGDGVVNLLKYAFGLDPHSPVGAGDLPEPEVVDGVLQLTYLERRNAPDLTYVPEFSLELSDWDSGMVEEVPGSRVPVGDFDQVTVRAVLPDGATRGFLHINVIRN